MEEKPEFPMRINKYLAWKKYSTRRGADELIEKKLVTINGRPAVIGDKVVEGDEVVVRGAKRSYRYFAYSKPRGVITHSPQYDEKDIVESVGIPGVFPVGRLDKDSHGLIILTDDGRVTERLLSPDSEHDKEYRVEVAHKLRNTFKEHMEAGVDIGDHVTRKCTVKILGERTFTVTLHEGKKHQIRRMCVKLHTDVVDLERTRVMNIELGNLKAGEYRPIEGKELESFLSSLGL